MVGPGMPVSELCSPECQLLAGCRRSLLAGWRQPNAVCEMALSTLPSLSGRPNCMRPSGAQRTFLGPIEGGICVIVSRSGQNSGP
jgi:hypothetical protein